MLNRRSLMKSLLALAPAALALTPARLLAARPLVKTPAQPEGPFYPVNFSAQTDANLRRHRTDEELARGVALDLEGQVLTSAGAPLPDVRVEIWQCDHQGIYYHPRSPNHQLFDRAFQGFGAATTDASGQYAFQTLVPSPYTGRPPHIHVKLWQGARELLTTQIYLAGHPGNKRDWIYLRALKNSPADALTMVLKDHPAPRVPGHKKAVFQFVV